MDDFATKIRALPPEKRALLLQKLPPLSYSQQRLWELEARGGGASNAATLPVRLSGPLDEEAFTQSFNEVVRRHEIMRTIFPRIDGRPVTLLLPSSQITLPLQDLSGYESAEREAKAQNLISAAAQQRFDLERGPLWRASLLRLGEAEHIVLLTVHHMVFDGWSTGVLLREVGHLYEVFRRGMESQLPDLPAQYGDYARWQKEFLSGERLGRQVDYWREQLRDLPPLPELPTDYPRPLQHVFNAASLPLMCDAPASASIKKLCIQEGVTLFMVGVTAFAVFLHARTGMKDFVVGVPVAGRNLAATEGLIGSFVNIILLRIRLAGDMPVADLLARIRDTTLEAHEHQELPFAKLLEEIYPGAEYDSYGVRGRAPLFRVVFDFKNVASQASFELSSLSVSLVETEDKLTGCDLYVKLWEENQLVAGSILYNRDVFSEQTATRMADEYRQILERLAPEQSLKVAELARCALPEMTTGDEADRAVRTFIA